MSNRNYTVTVICTGDIDEGNDALDAYIAGLKAAGAYFHSKDLEPEGPEAVDAPALNAGEGNTVEITLPNFVPEDGVDYYLQYSDDNWDTFTNIADNLGPNDIVNSTYNGVRRFRVSSNSTPGPSTALIP